MMDKLNEWEKSCHSVFVFFIEIDGKLLLNISSVKLMKFDHLTKQPIRLIRVVRLKLTPKILFSFVSHCWIEICSCTSHKNNRESVNHKFRQDKKKLLLLIEKMYHFHEPTAIYVYLWYWIDHHRPKLINVFI